VLLFASGKKQLNSKHEYLNPKQYRNSNFKGSKMRMENLGLRIENDKSDGLPDWQFEKTKPIFKRPKYTQSQL
jgi:hypothetical protein